jgi:hypothetical protein
MKFHKTKNGEKIKICDLETSHLKNIINLIERKSKEGITIRMGGGSTAEDMWYDEEEIYGEDVKIELNFYDYEKELKIRI